MENVGWMGGTFTQEKVSIDSFFTFAMYSTYTTYLSYLKYVI